MKSMKDSQAPAADQQGAASDRIVMVIASLRGGGAERVMTLLASEWVRRGRQVSLLTLDDGADAYEVSPGVERVRLGVAGASTGAFNALWNNWTRLRTLRRAILSRKPTRVISFMDQTNILTLMALRGTGIPVIVSQRIDPRHYQIGRGWEWLRRRLYPAADIVVVQTESVARWARTFVSPHKVRIIPNPVAVPPGAEAGQSPPWLPTGRYIAALGRLDRQKGYDLILHAFAELPAQFNDVRLVIMGEGPERAALEHLAASLAVSDRVIMPGRVDHAWPVLARCSVYVLSSRYEGFPNALMEAMATGAPVISYDCPSGPAEMIEDGVDGLLIDPENVDALAQSITRLLDDAALRDRLSAAARTKASQWGVESITDAWEAVFLSVNK